MVERPTTLALGAMSAALDPWILIPLALLLVALIALLYYVRKRQKTNREKPRATKATIGRLDLWRAWRRFKAQLPVDARANLTLFPHFIVVGDAGSGKTALIERSVEWKKKELQGYPSYTADPHISFYFGNNAIVTELSPSLLTDNSRAARDALRFLWWRQSNLGTPTFVIALNLSSKNPISQDALTDHAEYIRGRIGLLARGLGKAVPTNLALTFADDPVAYPGFEGLAQVMSAENVELYLDLNRLQELGKQPPKSHAAYLRRELDRYRSFTSQVLVAGVASEAVAQSAEVELLELDDAGPEEALVPDPRTERFHAAAAFFNTQALRWPDRLATCLWVLNTPDSQIPRPDFGRVYFTALTGPSVGHPMEVKKAQVTERSLKRLRLHRILASIFVLFAGGLPVLASLLAAKLERDAEQAIQAVRITPDASSVEAAVATLQPLEERSAAYAILDVFLPHFAHIPAQHQAKRQELAKAIREGLLLEQLTDAYARNDRSSGLDVVYTLGALYAASDNDLGKWVLDPAYEREWTAHLDVPISIVRGYVKMSDTRWDRAPAYIEKPDDLISTDTAEDLHRNRDDWADWLERLYDLTQVLETVITREDLEIIKTSGKELEGSLDEAADSVLATDIVAKLSNLDFTDPDGIHTSQRLDERYPRALKQDRHATWLQANFRGLRSILREVSTAALPEHGASGYDLKSFLVKVLPKVDGTKHAAIEIVGTGTEPSIVFDVDRWHSLIAVSDASYALAAYKPRFNRTGTVFFVDPDRDPLEFQGYERGSFYVRETIPWRYSRSALEGELVPLLKTLDPKLSRVQLSRNDREDLVNLIETEVAAYMRAYSGQWRSFFLSFQIRANNEGELAGILDKMNLTRSPLYETLEFLAENTRIASLKDAKYKDIVIRELMAFQPLGALVRGADATGDLLRAQQLLAQMQTSLEQAEKAAEEDKKEAEKSASGGWFSGLRKDKDATPTPASAGPILVDVEQQKAALKALEEELERLSKNAAGAASTRLADYQKIVGDLKEELQPRGFLATTDSEKEEKKEEASDARFRAQLSPVGNLAMDAIQRGLTQYDQRVEGWLNDSGVDPSLRRPFRELFQTSNSVGLRNVQGAVTANWTAVVRPQVVDYLSMYPFQGSKVNKRPDLLAAAVTSSSLRKAQPGGSQLLEVGIAQLERVLIPGSGFWTDVDELIAPAVESRGGKLVPRSLLTEDKPVRLELPQDMLFTLSHLRRISDTLWTKNGDRQNICMDVTPRPLPLARSDGWVANLSYLTLGESSIFGFNQREAPQSFVIPWWKQQDAVIGVRMASPSAQNDDRKPREDLRSIPDSPWALLRLLDEASCSKAAADCTGDLTWKLQVPITFLVSRDPRLLFDRETAEGQWPDLKCQSVSREGKATP